ncbi:MAG: hypothetical protein KIT25_03740 [Enhydrobacter sp.]|nr:MAG: hypothetical protein KIT25_03740 [Enhydrobacter sp.]
MAQDEIEIGDAVTCREQDTGEVCVLHVGADRIWVEFVGFGKRPPINADAPIYLHTAKGWVVSLFGNIDFSSAISSWRRGEVGSIYRQRIESNLALAGETPWLATDRVQSASFRLAPDCDFLWPRDRAAEVAETSVDAIPDRNIFVLPVVGGSISLDFTLRGDPIRNKWTPEQPSFTVRFDDGMQPLNCLDRIWYLRSLFALLAWRAIRSEGVSMRRIGAVQKSYSHRVLTPQLKMMGTDGAKAIRPIAVSAEDEAGRTALQAVLRVWLDRQDQWEEATGLMWRSLQRFYHVSAERAVDACRWHEAIERMEVGGSSPSGMEDVITAATAMARERKLHAYVGRIKGALGNIRGESRKGRFHRLAHDLKQWIGYSLFDDTGIKMLMGAYDARNKSAHGTLGDLSDPKVRELWGNLLAMEAFCAARAIAGLPLSERGREQLSMHPLFRAYQDLRKERAGGRMTPEA